MSNQMEPVYFASGSSTLFGLLHKPSAEKRRDVAVLLCNPFGYESVCAHRLIREIAESVAAGGGWALRFDYAGTGDSIGELGDRSDQIQAWTTSIIDAVTALRQMSGVAEITVLGLRLGATLGALAAAQTDAISNLIAIAPVVSGRRYIRELRSFQASVDDAADRGYSVDGTLEIGGFELTAASVRSLSAVDAMTLKLKGVKQALVIDRSDLPLAGGWAESLSNQGIRTDYLVEPGYVELMSSPHAAVLPQGIIDMSTEWLIADSNVGAPAAAQKGLESDNPTYGPRARAVWTDPIGLCQLTETAGLMGRSGQLFSVVTELQRPESSVPHLSRNGVLLLNCGATHHIGPNRMYVEVARRWASRGFVVMRLDIAGIGDSETRPGHPLDEVYPAAALEDIGQAMEVMRNEYGVDDLTVGGICSGAYHSLRAAVAGLPVSRIFMINPLTYFWREGMTLSDLQIAEIVRNPRVYRDRIMSGRSWMKLLRGKVDVVRIARIYGERIWLAIMSQARNIGRALKLKLKDDLGTDLGAVAARKIPMLFIFARGDAGSELLRIQGGSAVSKLRDHCDIHIIEDADHIFSHRTTRGIVVKLLDQQLPTVQ